MNEPKTNEPQPETILCIVCNTTITNPDPDQPPVCSTECRDEYDELGPAEHPFNTGDPVMDLAQGRPMIVLSAPELTVQEWSDMNDYDLTENYGNSKFDPALSEYVVKCVYVSNVRSEPSKTYTFPVSRVALIDAHHADDYHRVYDRVVVDVLETLFKSGVVSDVDVGAWDSTGIDLELVREARELSDVNETIEVEDK